MLDRSIKDETGKISIVNVNKKWQGFESKIIPGRSNLREKVCTVWSIYSVSNAKLGTISASEPERASAEK